MALFGALLRQDLEYLEQCPLETGVCGNILRPKNHRFRLAFFFGGMMLLIFLVLSHDFLGTAKRFRIYRLPGDLWQLRSLIGSCGTTISQAA